MPRPVSQIRPQRQVNPCQHNTYSVRVERRVCQGQFASRIIFRKYSPTNYPRDVGNHRLFSDDAFMSLASLLLSRDPDLVQPIRSAFEKHSIGVEVCVGPHAGVEILTTEHFDAVIVDCDDLQGGSEVLRDLRSMSANKSSVAIAVLNQRTSTAQAFQMGANFVIQKPVSSVNATRCASAAVAMMTRERRRFYRHPLDFSISAVFGKDEIRQAKATNISEGGMAVCFGDGIPTSSLTKILFRLPDMQAPLEFRADLAWADEQGRAGLRFVDPPRKAQELIEDWLTRQLAAKAKPIPSYPAAGRPGNTLSALARKENW